MDVHEFAEMDPAERSAWKRQRRIDKARISAALSGTRFRPDSEDARADARFLARCETDDKRERYLADILAECGAEYVRKVRRILASLPEQG